MANLLAKLRIEYSSLTMLQGVTDRPKEATISLHSKILEGFLEGQNDECFVSNLERKQLQEKTYRQLRLREMLVKYSSQASLIVMSLPMPRQVILYLLLRNQSSSLIFIAGDCLSPHVHELVGHTDDGHAAIHSRPRKSFIRLDVLFLRSQGFI